jgi:peptidoglycan/xylan/chitin deacetylase (PgdA/CDA1 family)
MQTGSRLGPLGTKASEWLRQHWGPIAEVRTSGPVVALTFDDGPDPRSTPKLLQILARHSAHATFFMVGKSAAQYPEIVAQAAAAGHAVGLHSWDHPSFPLISGKERRQQLRACARALAPHGTGLFRPPFGQVTPQVQYDVWRVGYQTITWNLDSGDWRNDDAKSIADSLSARIRPGCIVLLHDALYTTSDNRFCNREPTLEAVNVVLGRLSGRFRFASLPELLRQGPPERGNWRCDATAEFFNRLVGPDGKAVRQYARAGAPTSRGASSNPSGRPV